MFVSNKYSTTTDQRCISVSMAEMSSSATASVLPDSATNEQNFTSLIHNSTQVNKLLDQDPGTVTYMVFCQ